MGKTFALITGLLSLIIGISLVGMRVSKIKAGIVTNATVLRVERKIAGDDVTYRPVVRFTNYKNERMIFKPASYSADNNWVTGETIKLHYTKDRYDNVSMLTYWKTFGVALIFCCVALVTLLIAMGEYLAGRFFKTLNYPQPLT